MKILFISDFNLQRSGGIQRHINALLSQFREMGLDCAHLCSEDVPTVQVAGKKIVTPARLKAAIKAYQPDAVHIHGLASVFIGQALDASISLKKKTIYTPHYHPFHTLRRPFFARLFYEAYQKRLISKVDALITLTQNERKFFDQILPLDKIHIIPNGCTMDMKLTKDKVPKKLLFVGRNQPNKGLDFLISQFDFLASQNYELTIVTDSRKGLEETSFPKVLIKCSDDELLKQYQMASMVLIPSIYEAFSIVALEALANGCFILASEGVGLNEYAVELSSMYKVFPLNDDKEFQRILQSNFERQGHEAIFNFLNRFRWDEIAKHLNEIYESEIQVRIG